MPFETFDCVFDALADTLAESPTLRARFELLSALQSRIESWGVSEETAARRLGITRARLLNLVKGKLNLFSLDVLVKLTAAAGLAIELEALRQIAGKGTTQRAATRR